jgi:transcriptional regulator with XRE-family HTH domain
MADHNAVCDAAIVSPDRVRQCVQAILRAAQAEGWTDDQIEGVSGVRARTIKSYRIEGKEPSLSNALSLALALGGKHLNSILSLIGYVARPLDEADAINPHQLVASVLPHVSTLAAAAADGRFDHGEMPLCREAADQIIATVLPLSSAGGAV